MGLIHILKKYLKAVVHGGLFAKARLYILTPVPPALREKVMRWNNQQGMFSPEDLTLKEILASVDSSSEIIIVSTKRIGKSHNLTLTLTNKRTRML